MTAIIVNHQERIRFLKFIVVGFIGALVDFGVMNILTHSFQFSLTFAGTVSFITAVTSNFIWNRYWTYPDSRSRPLPRQLAMFFLVNLAGIIIRIPILHFLGPFILSTLTRTFLARYDLDAIAKNLTLLVAVAVVMLWNFLVNRYWTYNDI